MTDNRTDSGSTNAPKNQPFDSESDRLIAIKQTHNEMAPPTDLDIKKLVSSAISAYWKQEEKRKEGIAMAIIPVTGTLQETALLRRGLAMLIGSPIREFFTDIGAVIAPVLCVMFGMYFAYRHEDNVLANLPRSQMVKPLILGFAVLMSLLVLLAFIQKPLTRIDSPFVKHSVGALVGGIVVSVMIGHFTRSYISEFKHSRASDRAYVQGELERLAVQSIEQQRMHKKFLNPRADTGGALQMASWQLETNVGEEEATYSINLDRNSWVAQVDRKGRGSIITRYSDGRDEVHSIVIAGVVTNVTDESFDLRSANGKIDTVNINSDVVLPPKETFVIVTMNPISRKATAIVDTAAMCGQSQLAAIR